MNKFETWIFKKIFRKRGPKAIMSLVWEETERRFYEDNIYDRESFLQELIKDECDLERDEIRARFPQVTA